MKCLSTHRHARRPTFSSIRMPVRGSFSPAVRASPPENRPCALARIGRPPIVVANGPPRKEGRRRRKPDADIHSGDWRTRGAERRSLSRPERTRGARALPRSAGAHRRTIRGRRSRRPDLAADCAKTLRRPGQAVLRGEPGRRRRQYRHGDGRPRAGGRLHDHDRELDVHDQSEPLRQGPLRSDQGLRPRDDRGDDPEPAGRAYIGAGDQRERAHRAHPRRQVQELCDAGRGHAVACSGPR